MSGMIADMLSDALLQHSSGLMDRLMPDLLPDTPSARLLEPNAQPPMHETILIVPAGAQTPLELHIDNCHRRCVALYDTQRIVQFGG